VPSDRAIASILDKGTANAKHYEERVNQTTPRRCPALGLEGIAVGEGLGLYPPVAISLSKA